MKKRKKNVLINNLLIITLSLTPKHLIAICMISTIVCEKLDAILAKEGLQTK